MNTLLVWLKDFFAIPADASFWSILNAPIFVGVIAAVIGWQLNRRITSAQEQAQTAQDEAAVAVKVAESHDESLDFEVGFADAAFESHSGGETEDYREEFRALAENAKAFIEQRINADTDKRHQRTYSRFSRHHPISRAIALRERDRITSEQEHALVTLIRTWNRFNKGRAASRPVPKEVLELMEANWKTIQS